MMKNFSRGKPGGGFKGGKSYGDRGGFHKKPSFGGRGGGFGGGREGGFNAMHPATCSGCGQSCEVPFRPTGSRPVYCRNCFKKEEGDFAPKRFEKPSFGSRPSFDRSDRPSFRDERPSYKPAGGTGNEEIAAQLKIVISKLDAILGSMNG